MDSGYPQQDFSSLATSPSSNFKRAGSGSRWSSKPHKGRGITEVSNRNTISKDSTQSNGLWVLELRNRATISKDLTQSDGPFKSEMQNRVATSKDKTGSGKAHITAFSPGGSLNPAQIGAMPPNDSPGLYAIHRPSPAQAQRQGQGPQHTHNYTTLHVQMHAQAGLVYDRLMGAAAAKFGGPGNIPQDTVDKIKQQSYAQAEQSVRDLVQQRVLPLHQIMMQHRRRIMMLRQQQQQAQTQAQAQAQAQALAQAQAQARQAWAWTTGAQLQVHARAKHQQAKQQQAVMSRA